MGPGAFQLRALPRNTTESVNKQITFSGVAQLRAVNTGTFQTALVNVEFARCNLILSGLEYIYLNILARVENIEVSATTCMLSWSDPFSFLCWY